MNQTEIDELRRLHEAATPGPWTPSYGSSSLKDFNMKGIDAEAEVARMNDASKLGQWSAPDEYGCRHLLTDADRLADVVWRMCDEMGYPRTTDGASRIPGALHSLRVAFPMVGAACKTALDMLGVALADHGHTWTDEQRTAYETAIKMIDD
jgi:hypothetical protein